jgi:hypothetical protein
LRGELWFRIDSKMFTHTRRVMLLFDFLGKIGGLNRLLWTIGGLILSYCYKDRLAVEIIETLYDVEKSG